MALSINLLSDLQEMLGYQFMQHAFEAGTVVAIIAGITGYFVVLRRSAFTAHAFSEIGFAGAAGAVLLGIAPIAGLLLGSSIGGLAIAGPGVHSYWTARQGERQAEEQWKSQLARRPQAPPRAHRGRAT